MTPTNGSSSILGGFSNGFNNENNIEFPMDIEEDSSVSLINTDYNRNLFQNSEFLEKAHPDVLHSYEQSQFNRMKMENCDNQFSVKGGNGHISADTLVVKSEFCEEQKPHNNCTKNGLIGNFDHNLFETLKSNNVNNNTCNDLFLIPQEGKFTKDDNKSLINNLHLSNNYDLFTTSIDNTAMDFESIIPYNDLPSHDSLFQISSFDRGNFGSFNDHNNTLLFNDDTRMSNSESMTCEVDNLLCNL